MFRTDSGRKPGAEPESLEIRAAGKQSTPWRFCPLVPFVKVHKLSASGDGLTTMCLDTRISRAEYEDIKQ